MNADASSNLEGRVIVVTGATNGIGKAAAMVLARQRATVVLVSRDAARTGAAVAELRRTCGNEHVEALTGDLSSFSEVRAIAAAFKQRHDRLDVLVNNAGALFAERGLSADGFERTFALNHLGAFLLTHELGDWLRKTPGARVVNTSSGSHRRGRLDDLEEVARRNRSYTGEVAYCDSKLANVLFTRELARRLASTGVAAHCFDPGFVRSGFGADSAGLLRRALLPLARSPEKGAETLVWLATRPDAAKDPGGYYRDGRLTRVSRAIPAAVQVAWVAAAGVLGTRFAPFLPQPALAQLLPALGVGALVRLGVPLGHRRLDEAAQRLWAFSERACGLG